MSDLSAVLAARDSVNVLSGITASSPEWFVLGEDLARVVIGPFPSRGAAIDFIDRTAGGGSVDVAVPANVIFWLDADAVGFLTPEQALTEV